MDKYTIINGVFDFGLATASAGCFEIRYSNGNASIFSGFNNPAFNYVCLTEKDDDFLNQLKQKDIPFLVIPTKEFDQDIDGYMQANMLTVSDPTICQLYNDLTAFNYTINEDLGLTVKQVINKQLLEDYDHVSAIGFQHDKGLAYQFLEGIINHEHLQMFVAYKNNIPVSCGILSTLNNMPGLYWGAVLPEYRKKGIASELTKYRMNIIKQLGYKFCVVQNMPMSVNFYQRLGYEPLGTVNTYVYIN